MQEVVVVVRRWDWWRWCWCWQWCRWWWRWWWWLERWRKQWNLYSNMCTDPASPNINQTTFSLSWTPRSLSLQAYYPSSFIFCCSGALCCPHSIDWGGNKERKGIHSEEGHSKAWSFSPLLVKTIDICTFWPCLSSGVVSYPLGGALFLLDCKELWTEPVLAPPEIASSMSARAEWGFAASLDAAVR